MNPRGWNYLTYMTTRSPFFPSFDHWFHWSLSLPWPNISCLLSTTHTSLFFLNGGTTADLMLDLVILSVVLSNRGFRARSRPKNWPWIVLMNPPAVSSVWAWATCSLSGRKWSGHFSLIRWVWIKFFQSFIWQSFEKIMKNLDLRRASFVLYTFFLLLSYKNPSDHGNHHLNLEFPYPQHRCWKICHPILHPHKTCRGPSCTSLFYTLTGQHHRLLHPPGGPKFKLRL